MDFSDIPESIVEKILMGRCAQFRTNVDYDFWCYLNAQASEFVVSVTVDEDTIRVRSVKVPLSGVTLGFRHLEIFREVTEVDNTVILPNNRVFDLRLASERTYPTAESILRILNGRA